MKKKVYLSNIEWEKVYEDKGGVKATIVFNDLMTYEEYKKLLNSIYFLLEILGDKENE